MTLALSPSARRASMPAKACKTCKVTKPISDFPPHRGSKGGHRVHCRDCLITGRYQPTPETPAQRKHCAERQGRRSWQHSHGQALRKYGDHNPLKTAAVRALATAVTCGRLKRGTHCQVAGCCSQKSIKGHHWPYSLVHQQDVLWCCAAHHRQGHARSYITPDAGIPLMMHHPRHGALTRYEHQDHRRALHDQKGLPTLQGLLSGQAAFGERP